MSSPATTGYPGTVIMMVVVGFTGYMTVKYTLIIYKIRRNHVTYIEDLRGNKIFGIMGTFLFLFLMAMASIYTHYMNTR